MRRVRPCKKADVEKRKQETKADGRLPVDQIFYMARPVAKWQDKTEMVRRPQRRLKADRENKRSERLRRKHGRFSQPQRRRVRLRVAARDELCALRKVQLPCANSEDKPF